MGAINKEPSYRTLIGKNLRRLREYRGFTQTDLANALGVTHQQIQKYEKGTCGFSAIRLHTLSRILHVPVEDFFNGFENPAVACAIPPAINPAILVRALKIQTRCETPERQKILHIIDILTNS